MRSSPGSMLGEPLTGHEGLLKGMLKASLERGLETELSDHVGYDRGDPAAAEFENSRNGTLPQDSGVRDRRRRTRPFHVTATARSPRCWSPERRPSSRWSR